MTGSFLPLIDLLISLLTAIHHVYKLLIHNLNHKMIENNLDFYLEDITESTRNTNRIKELRGIKNNQIFHVRQNSTQKFYQYRLDKIGQFKGYLRCIDYKCNSRLEVIFGLEMTTVKLDPILTITLTLNKILKNYIHRKRFRFQLEWF